MGCNVFIKVHVTQKGVHETDRRVGPQYLPGGFPFTVDCGRPSIFIAHPEVGGHPRHTGSVPKSHGDWKEE